MLKALVVDDTPANKNFLSRLLTQAQFKVLEAGTGQEALNIMYQNDDPLALTVVDMQLPDMNGLQLTMRLRERYPNALIVVATMHDDFSWIKKSFEMGANIYLVKPHGFMELFHRLMASSIEDLREDGKIIIDQYGPREFAIEESH